MPRLPVTHTLGNTAWSWDCVRRDFFLFVLVLVSVSLSVVVEHKGLNFCLSRFLRNILERSGGFCWSLSFLLVVIFFFFWFECECYFSLSTFETISENNTNWVLFLFLSRATLFPPYKQSLGVYGDVQRVKILYNKKDSALIQMAEPHQAYLGE